METSPSSETYIDTVECTKLNSTFKSHHFYTNKEIEVSELDKPLVFISASDIPNVRKIQDILEFAIKSNRSILLIAPLESQPLTALAMNMVKGNINLFIIAPPSPRVHHLLSHNYVDGFLVRHHLVSFQMD